MIHIEISWLVSSGIEQATIAINSHEIQKYRVGNVCGERTLGLIRSSDYKRYVMMLEALDVESALAISGHVREVICDLAGPYEFYNDAKGRKSPATATDFGCLLMPECYGAYAKADPVRQFVSIGGLGGVSRVVTHYLNKTVADLDAKSDEARKELRNSKRKCSDLVAGITRAAKDLKATRSDRISSLVGGKIRNIRLYLERLAQ